MKVLSAMLEVFLRSRRRRPPGLTVGQLRYDKVPDPIRYFLFFEDGHRMNLDTGYDFALGVYPEMIEAYGQRFGTINKITTLDGAVVWEREGIS